MSQNDDTTAAEMGTVGQADAPDYSQTEENDIDPESTGDDTSEAAQGDTEADEKAAGPAEEKDPGNGDSPVSTGAVE
ncbi:hypothetical protein [Gephyromycinifex aptenodytis]|uniref:hypothetical protein n=1 Tax=Gephyromycinifex aptenodytis TaxID=2716227 RepID=UPI001447EBFE|nr:hypothetical protein [Gephyromycinifex aptenodytis]